MNKIECPVCKNTNVSDITVDMNNDHIYVRMECHFCEAKWTDIYTRRAVIDLAPGMYIEFAN